VGYILLKEFGNVLPKRYAANVR